MAAAMNHDAIRTFAREISQLREELDSARNTVDRAQRLLSRTEPYMRSPPSLRTRVLGHRPTGPNKPNWGPPSTLPPVFVSAAQQSRAVRLAQRVRYFHAQAMPFNELRTAPVRPSISHAHIHRRMDHKSTEVRNQTADATSKASHDDL